MSKRSVGVIIPGGYRSGSTTLCKALLEAGVYGGTKFLTHMEDRRIWEANGGELVSCKEENRMNDNASPFKYEPDPWFVNRLADIRDHYEKCGRPYYFIKDPQIARFMKAYVMVWPDAKWIVCEREGHQAILSQRHREKCGHIQIGHIRKRSLYMDNIWHYCMANHLHTHLLSHAAMGSPLSAEAEECALTHFLGFRVPLIKNWKHNTQIRDSEDLLFEPPVSYDQLNADACRKPDASEDGEGTAGSTSEGEQEAPPQTCPQDRDE